MLLVGFQVYLLSAKTFVIQLLFTINQVKSKCADFTTVTGQTTSLSTNGTDTSINFVCASGYTLTGSSSLTCYDDGTWDGQQPQCVSCETLTNPSSGTVTLNTNGGTTTAIYTCASGYTLQGDTTRTCQLDGTWDNSQPTCSCNQPSAPSNGAVVANGVTATYTCKVGFTLDGFEERTCQTDGSGWSNQDPVCSQCTSLSSVTGGSFSTSTTGTVTSAKYLCQTGYTLDGVTTITCQSDGSWSSSPPTCMECPELTNPSSGTVTLSSSGTKTSATYACASGYNLNGNTVRLCNMDGTWSLMEPTCSCKSPVPPLNGLVTDDGSTATYTCNQGFSLSGLSTRICNTDGTGWGGADPTCNICSTLSTHMGGTVAISSNGINTQATYTCFSGYTLNGMSPITCRSDGSWDFTAPTCSKCPDLPDPDSGTLIVTTTGSVTTATFTCQTGYYLSGDFTLTCGTDGAWSSDAPTCKCNFPAQPSNGEVSVSGTGSVATYSCDTGYSLSGLSARTCQTDGSGWESTDPTCNVCQTVTNPASGLFSLSSNGTHTSVRYTCDVGTTLSGVNVQVCMDDGSWEAAPPTCVGCPTPNAPGSGTVVLSTSSSSTIATFSCGTGYTLNSTSVLTCTSAGTWDYPTPYCICVPPSALTNGEVNLSDDFRTVTYTCHVGYVLVGSATRTCQDDGTGWDGISPVCVLCPSLDEPSSGTVTLSTSGTQTKATYTCDAGYNLNGDEERMCNSDGTWSMSEPTCTCETPADPLNGLVTADGATATYTCNQGYSMNGASTRTCGDDGTGWSGTAPTCSTCDTLSTPSGGTVTVSTNGVNTQVAYTCNTGYTLNGVSIITCRSDGSWDFTQPSCEKCPELSEPDSGSLTLTSTGSLTTASFSCLPGYYLKGKFSLTCGTDGTWNDDAPSCKCDFPPQPTNGQVSLSGTGTVATYRCDTGYTLTGLSDRTCQDDGTGWEGPDPVCTLCQTLTTPLSGSISYSTDGIQTTADYACAVGTTIDGKKQIVCNDDGSWESNQPSCVQCPTLSDPNSGSVSLSSNGLTTSAEFSCVFGYTINSTSVLTCLSSGHWDLPAPFCICQSPPLVANGQFNISADLLMVTYTCNAGYVLVGSETRTCQNDGTGWDGISPVCEFCLPLSNPIGGSFTLSSDGATTTANYSCVVGYNLVGDSERICKQDKTWSPSQPLCVKCDTLNYMSSGNIVITTDGYTSTALYTCVTGYYLVGSSKRTCQADGSWDGTTPQCDCHPPSTITNGAVFANGKTANYTCKNGTTILGLSSRICNTDGTGWSDSDPQCNQCQSAYTPTGGLYTLSTTGTQTYAVYYCESGYTLSGAYKVYCQFTGNWDSVPVCVQCDALPTPESGSYLTTTTGRVTIAVYSCYPGYDLVGSNTRTCQPDGSWDLDAPTCICQSPSTIQNGQVTDNGETANYTCDVGYSLDGAISRTCAKDGTRWTGSDPVCNPCQTLASPTGGSVTMTSDGHVTMVAYSCDVGYTLSGLNNITCRSDGTWTFSEPECVLCPTLTNPGSGSVTMTSDSLISKATFSCVTGYYVSGQLTITCQTNGAWDSDPPACKCITPVTPAHGSVSVSDTADGPVATYRCDLGYSIDGPASRLCQNDGTGWEGRDPTCNICESINTPPELNFDVSTNGSTTYGQYACALNYTLSGEYVHICQADGTWDYPSPSCVSCAGKTHPLSGQVALTTDGLRTRATFSCEQGYDLLSVGVTTCLTDGSWNLPDPLCVCQPPNAIIDGNYDLLDNGMIANYSCDSSYKLVGPQQRLCLTDGTGWNGTEPRCDLIIITTPRAGKSQEETVLPIPTAAFVAIFVILIIILVVSIGGSVCWYLRYKKVSQRVGTVFDSSDNRTTSTLDEARFNFESTDIEDGNLLIAKSLEPAKPTFNAKSLKKKSSRSSLDTNKTEDEMRSKQSNLETKIDLNQNGGILTAGNGTPPHVPLSSVRLPKLPPKPPRKSNATKVKRKRRRVERREEAADEKDLKPRTSTPIEIVMNRTKTPDMLASEEFTYIQPVYCHEADTPAPSRPTTSTSRYTSKTVSTESNV
ncbi:sushi, von Willebrand factor type A, EGF and pentraxin domain-containing protein 1-like [Ruditapes philippinarum]|uniref:sushi, von Willebrand factor type A, EGF and pentraxin domain-containing protein 1-like n=1 Tax=Ruditapes philippinarum TaxID=129788 RepID=UPI00295ACCD7|nr:sushi, von Willebrand factor type A, EGF and pentraxin domain-containing protein 1-like [Ruditapes philippinarum]